MRSAPGVLVSHAPFRCPASRMAPVHSLYGGHAFSPTVSARTNNPPAIGHNRWTVAFIAWTSSCIYPDGVTKNIMTRSPGRTGHRWRMLVAQVKAEESHCWICNTPIDHALPPRSPMSFSVDHVLPLKTHPHLAQTRSNLRAAHLHCNVVRSNTGNRNAATEKDRTSRAW